MTNEEAIEAIKCNWPDSRYTILREALDMAISALRQQETVIKCHDLFDEDDGEITHVETVTNRNELNEPLTLDELRNMDGEPVWVVWTDGRIKSKWWIVNSGCWMDMFWDDHGNISNDYGTVWVAYRQKQEEGDGMICDDDFYAGICPARTKDGRCVSKYPCGHKAEPPKPMTNAQRIRAMSDEELLGCLLELQDIAIKRFANFEPPDYQWMADWLQQPCEVGE